MNKHASNKSVVESLIEAICWIRVLKENYRSVAERMLSKNSNKDREILFEIAH